MKDDTQQAKSHNAYLICSEDPLKAPQSPQNDLISKTCFEID